MLKIAVHILILYLYFFTGNKVLPCCLIGLDDL